MKRLTLLEVSDASEFKEWSKEIVENRYTEAIDSLKDEGVTLESVFFIELEGKKYLAFYMEGECRPADKTKPINQRHREILRKIVEGKIDTELLYSVENR